ncbi:MAG: hypothetical protein AAF922_20475 [Pseudomonadota bacterium]
MIETHGSAEKWQRQTTLEWFERLTAFKAKTILVEGHSRIGFLQEAVSKNNIKAVRIVLVDCENAIRSERLAVDRGQPELTNSEMMNWAAFLNPKKVTKHVSVNRPDTYKRLPKTCEEIISNSSRYILWAGSRPTHQICANCLKKHVSKRCHG